MLTKVRGGDCSREAIGGVIVIKHLTPFVGVSFLGQPVVPISVFVFLFKTLKLREPRVKIRVINCLGNFLPETGPGPVVQISLAREVRAEAGQTLPGRTDRDPGEVGRLDGQSLRGGGDRGPGPVIQGLPDQEPGSQQAGHHHGKPDQARQASATSDVRQAVNGGGTQELLQSFHLFQLMSSGSANCVVWIIDNYTVGVSPIK